MFWLIVIGSILAVAGVVLVLALIDYRSGSVPGGGTPLGSPLEQLQLRRKTAVGTRWLQ